MAERLERRAAALEDLKAGLTLTRREQWEPAAAALGRAAESGALEQAHTMALYAAQSRCLWHLRRFDQALQAARQHRALREELGEADDPMSCAMLAQALSFRYAETGDERLREQATQWLDRFVALATAAGKSAAEVAVFTQPTLHRLETRSTILNIDYLIKAYPSDALSYARIPTGRKRFLHCDIVRDGRWAAIRLIALDSDHLGTKEDGLAKLELYAEGGLDSPLFALDDPAGLPLHERRLVEVPQAQATEHPIILVVQHRRDGRVTLEAFAILGDAPLALPSVARTLAEPFGPKALRDAMRDALHARQRRVRGHPDRTRRRDPDQ